MTDATDTSQVLPTAPPPPQEVKVRTLKSDLASIAASGGGLPRYENVKITHTEQQQKNATNPLVVIVVIVLLLIIFSIAGYFVYQLILKK
jgi:hypothetical protein